MENHIKMDDLGVPLFSETSIYPSKIIVMELLAAYIHTRLLDQIGERFLLNYNLPCPTCCLPNPEPHAMSFKTSFCLRHPHDKEATTGKSYYGDASLYFLRADGEEAPKIARVECGVPP